MTVFLVKSIDFSRETEIWGAYSTQEKAKEIVEKVKGLRNKTYVYFQELKVDEFYNGDA